MTGILYDDKSGNTGDTAIGISVKKILSDLKLNFVDGISDTTIVGGGHLLRKLPDPFYDRFRLHGNHILNCMGIVGEPTDLHYLNDYKYVTFRSNGDRNKVPYIKDATVVPCTTMLLEDIADSPLPEPNSLGIHVFPNMFGNDIDAFCQWVSSLPYNKIYFIPITHYVSGSNEYFHKLGSRISNSVVAPVMTPQQAFTFIGKLEKMISCSLHGAIFSYIHNVPFILKNEEKMQFFMQDRQLDKCLFDDFNSMREIFTVGKTDYSGLVSKDMNVLREHIYNLKNILK